MTSMHQNLTQTIFMQKMGIVFVISSFQILMLFSEKKGLKILLNSTGKKSISIQDGNTVSINS